MKSILLAFIMFSAFHSGVANNTPEQKKHYRIVYFYSYGLHAYWDDDKKCQSKCQKDFGFGYKVKAGCVVRPLQLARLKAHNTRIENKMIRRFGADWKDQYEKALKKCNS
jgi:hypothetical protein